MGKTTGNEGLFQSKKSNAWLSILLTLLGLAVVYGVGSTFFTIEVERLVERSLTPHILASRDVSAMNDEIFAGVNRFMASKHVRVIGYSCLGLAILVGLVGLVGERLGLASLGSLGFISSIYAYFMLHMSFLAGLGVLTALWAPFWGNLVKLGDIAYLPYMFLVYPAALAGVDIRVSLAGFTTSLGLFIFIMGVLAWLYARFWRKGTADFWIYRFSRHPQYLGWILWSYGLMLRVALRQDTPLGSANPGASLPWVISTLILVCVALAEEVQMRRQHPQSYARYSSRAPFMVPLPRLLGRWIAAPLRLVLKKSRPETRWDLLWTFLVYLVVTMLLSAPFVLLEWPPTGWMNWPF